MTHRHGFTQALALAASIAMLCLPAQPQTAQKGVDANANARGRERLRIDYVGYRAARWETEHVTEVEIDRPNQGGLIHVYYTNVSDQPFASPSGGPIARTSPTGASEALWPGSVPMTTTSSPARSGSSWATLKYANSWC